jgi:parallel beta-helix repeat protein
MRVLHRAAFVLIFPAIAWLGAACDGIDPPTEPQSAAEMLNASSPHTHWVNDDDPNGGLYVPPGTSCTNPGYRTIQEAVTAASAGDHINVCPGLYPEQVTIPADKDDLRLRSTRQWEAVIKAPAVMLPDPHPILAYSIVRIEGAQNVTLLAFTITGPGPGGCASLHYGVRVASGGSADILGNHITDIRDAPPPPTVSGCQNGVAVLVGRWIDGTTGSARIMGNVIERYQKNGPTVDNAGSFAEISHNRILGVGPTPTIAQNGSQASRGATATIRHNFIANNLYTGPQDAASSGILWYAPGQVVTEHNTLSANDVGVNISDFFIETQTCGTAEGSIAGHNRVRASTYDGIVLSGFTNCPVNEVQIAYNKSEQNEGPGIGVYDADDNSIDNNSVEDNKDTGILLGDEDGFFPATNNTVANNQVRDNGTAAGGDLTDGIRINTGSTTNTVHNNHLRDNVTHDCHDNNTPVANTWDGNHGETSFPPGLCDRENNDAAFATSTAYGWDPAYPWYDAFDVAAEFDWATAYATIDTESLLQLLPGLQTGGTGRPVVSPQQ